jgi:triacylglycerol lipase
MFQFESSSQELSLLNALRLAEMSYFAYGTQTDIHNVLSGFSFPNFRFFDVADTQAFVAGNDDIVIIAFRGTTSIKDWLTDIKIKLFSFSNGRIHTGFHEALDVIWDDLYRTVRTFQDRNQTIWITGHSLGGALAVLAAAGFLDDGVVDLQGVYTFGQPKVGDKIFGKYVDSRLKSKLFRFVYDEDLVTIQPPFGGYVHIGCECYFDRMGRFYDKNIGWAKFYSRCASIAIRSSERASDFRAANPGGIADHGMGYYIRCIKNEMIRRDGGPKTFEEYINFV